MGVFSLIIGGTTSLFNVTFTVFESLIQSLIFIYKVTAQSNSQEKSKFWSIDKALAGVEIIPQFKYVTSSNEYFICNVSAGSESVIPEIFIDTLVLFESFTQVQLSVIAVIEGTAAKAEFIEIK